MRPKWILACVILVLVLIGWVVRLQTVPAYALPEDSPSHREDEGALAVYTVISKKGDGPFEYVVEDQYGNRYACTFHTDLPPVFMTSRQGSLRSVRYRIIDAETGLIFWSSR